MFSMNKGSHHHIPPDIHFPGGDAAGATRQRNGSGAAARHASVQEAEPRRRVARRMRDGKTWMVFTPPANARLVTNAFFCQL